MAVGGEELFPPILASSRVQLLPGRKTKVQIWNGSSIYEYQFNTMRVSELRTKLDEKGLDVDGSSSREAMIATLQDFS